MSTKDSKEGIKAGPVCAQSHTPPWWTERLQASWSKARVDALRDWRELTDDGNKVGHAMDEAALAFGHGARETYELLQTWESALEDTLKVDWKETGHEAGCAWTRVRSAVKHGWERAGDHGKPDAREDGEKTRPPATCEPASPVRSGKTAAP